MEGLATFDRLCTLVGRWEDVDHPVMVAYRMTAHGSVLVETWHWQETGIESLTLYHLDGEHLIATHYCPVGNQPRLRLTASPQPDTISFEFVDVTNLTNSDESHCIAFWFRLKSDLSFVRSETYREGGIPTEQQRTYRRMPSHP